MTTAIAMQDNETRHADGMGSMEIMGALTLRLVHDLTNQLTILAGNAQVLELVRDNPERLAKVVDRIRTSTETTGVLLDRFSKFRQQLNLRATPAPLAEVVQTLGDLNPMPGTWTIQPPEDLGGAVELEPRWLAFAIWESAILTRSAHGRIELSIGPFPADWEGGGHIPAQLRNTSLLRCELSWKSSAPWMSEVEASKPEDFNLATVYEIIKMGQGWAHYRFIHGGDHRFNFFVPLSKRTGN